MWFVEKPFRINLNWVYYTSMTTWKEIKEKFELHKNKVVLVVCFILVFIVGFGSGRFAGKGESVTTSVPSNYTTTANKAKASPPAPKEKGTDPEVLGQATSGPPVGAMTAECPIKGNISSTGRNLYHVKGGAFYERVKAERCFNTKAEAEADGFVASSR